MSSVTISPKYQVVIPKDVRDQLALKPGEKLQAMVYEGRIVLIPVRSAKQLKGFLSGLETSIPRDKDRL